MAIKFDKIEPGMILLDVHREKMGNTTMSEWGWWEVRIISVDRDKRTAQVSWNHNQPQTYRQRQLERLYVNKPKALRDQEESYRKHGRFGGIR